MSNIRQAETNRVEGRRSLSLMQKLTMLVAFPLVFEFLFVGSLTILLVTAQSDATRIERAKEAEAISNNILQCMYKLVSTGFLGSLKHDSLTLETYRSAKKEISEQLAMLRDLCANDAEALRSAQIVTVLTHRLTDALDVLTDDSKKSFEQYLRTSSEIGMLSRSFMRECAAIASFQRRIHPHATTHTDWQTIIYSVLAAGLLLSLGVSAGALRYVHLDLLERILKIMRNTEAIARREPLVETVQGSDELATLDKFVHETDDSLRQLERMRQEFFGMLTHDMRAPLTTIQFSVAILADGAYEASPEKRQNMLKSLVPEIGRLNRLVEDLLSANRLETEPLKLTLEPVYSRELLEQVKNTLELEANSRNRSIEIHCDDNYVMADGFQIGRVLINLCANALRYAQMTVQLRCAADGGMVLFEVIDDGPGIPPAVGATLFQRYRQGDDDKTRSGFGLGLFIAKSIIDAHGGEIGYRNVNGDNNPKGCVFFFSLKCCND
jgi:signal transduction histidine kinase